MLDETGKEEHNLVILSLKNFRKDEARVEFEREVGREGGSLRERRPSKADQSFLGLSEEFVIKER